MSKLTRTVAVFYLTSSFGSWAVAIPTDRLTLISRADTCGGDASLNSCGGPLPPNFCCPQSTICLPLNVTDAVAVVCCPLGSSCESILPTTCDQTAYDATKVPTNQIHSSPTANLTTCGNACCTMGYSCQNGMCIAQAASALPDSVSSTVSSSSVPSSSPTSTATSSTSAAPPHQTSSALASSTSVADTAILPMSGAIATSSAAFSGSSFAAGFVPGIIIGMILLVAVTWCLARRRKKGRIADGEKHLSQDQLTTLSPLDGPRRPTLHLRTISEPTVDPTGGHRTDFLRCTPDRANRKSFNGTSNVTVESLAIIPPPGTRTPRLKQLFNFSPNPNLAQSPLPSHLKRGTLSHTITPIRQLRTKIPTRPLRRHMTDASHPARGSSRKYRSDVSRSGSTETIQVLMPSMEPHTPDQRPMQTTEPTTTLSSASYEPPQSSSSWHRTNTILLRASPAQGRESTTFFNAIPRPSETPTQKPSIPQRAVLGTPYSPSRYYETIEGAAGGECSRTTRNDEKRVTTFGGLMERAGLRREDFITGPPPRG